MGLLRKVVVLTMFCVVFAAPVALAREPNVPAPAPNMDALIDQQMQAVNMTDIEQYLKELQSEYQGYLPPLTLNTFLRMAKGEKGFEATAIFKALLSVLFYQMVSQGGLLIKIVILGVLGAVVGRLHETMKGTAAEIAQVIMYLIIMGVILVAFQQTTMMVKEAIVRMDDIMYAILPVLAALLTAMGQVTSAAILSPVVVMAVTAIGQVVQNWVLPLLMASGVLTVADGITSTVKVSRLAAIFKDVAIGILGLSFSVFVGISTGRSLLTGVADGVVLRTGKYAFKNFVPVLGSLMADSIETVAGAAAVIRSTVGFAGLVIVLLTCALPALRILGTMMIYRIASALLQPLGESKVSEALNKVAGLFMYLFGAVAAVGVMLYILITVVISTGNTAIMIR